MPCAEIAWARLPGPQYSLKNAATPVFLSAHKKKLCAFPSERVSTLVLPTAIFDCESMPHGFVRRFAAIDLAVKCFTLSETRDSTGFERESRSSIERLPTERDRCKHRVRKSGKKRSLRKGREYWHFLTARACRTVSYVASRR